MDRDPGDFDKRDADASSDPDEDARIDALLASLPPAPGIKHIDDDDIERDIAGALADVAAGRFYSHAVVSEWLMTWGETGQKSFKDWLADRDG
ncbi:MAG: hypothetical protein V4537_02360 [Pseudomonadota bacterium]